MEQETIVVTEEEPQVTPEKRFSWKGMLQGALSWIRSLLTKDGLKRMLPWLLVLLCISTFAYECTNYYKTPIKYSVKISNQEIYDIEEVSIKAWNGLATKELWQILQIMHNSDAYQELLENAQHWIQRDYADRITTYGESYELTVQELYRRPLLVQELRETRREIRGIISEIGYLVDQSEEFKSADWRELADGLELTKDEAQKLIEVYSDLVNKMEPVQVTEGYVVTLERTITGDLLEKPEVFQQDITVIKLNGRWVLLDIFETMELFFHYSDF